MAPALPAPAQAALTGQQAAEQPAPGSTGQPDPDGQAEEEVRYAAPTTADRIGRIMAPVFLNNRGPFLFVVDSGASRSVITPRVLAQLGLSPDPENALMLRGVTGTAEVPSVLITSLTAGDIVLADQRLPVVATEVFANADGILGVDGFGGMCLQADFANNRIAITGKECPRAGIGWVRIPASLRFGQLLRVGAVIRGRTVHAIIDTGAARSLGNHALLRALSLEDRLGDPGSNRNVIGATAHEVQGDLLVVPRLSLGKIGIRNMRITFGDFSVFQLWDLVEEPAMVVGMDILGTVDGS